MYCKQCGKQIQDGLKSCSECGCEIQVQGVQIQDSDNIVGIKRQNNTKLVVLFFLVGFAVVAILSIFIIGGIQKSILKSNLDGTWFQLDGSLILYLDFDSKEVEYYSQTVYTGKYSFATMKYKVINMNTIEIRGEKYKVEITDTAVTFTPSFTNGESHSRWLKE